MFCTPSTFNINYLVPSTLLTPSGTVVFLYVYLIDCNKLAFFIRGLEHMLRNSTGPSKVLSLVLTQHIKGNR